MAGTMAGARHDRPELVVILAGVSSALHVGKLSPALPVLRDALGVTLLQAGFLLSVVQLAGMLLGLAVGLAADGIGLKRSMLAGLALLSLAGAAGGWAQDAASLLLLRALEGVGFLLASMPAPGLIRRLVQPHRMNSTLGLWGAYMPLGTALALLIGPPMLDALGWRVWWWLLAGLSSAMVVWLWLSVPSDRPESPQLDADPTGSQTEVSAWAARLRRTLSSRGPWLVALGFALYSGQWLAVIGFLPSVVARGGSPEAVTTVLIALVAAVNMVGNIASGRLLHRGFQAHVLLYVGFCAMALGALIAFANSPGTLTESMVRAIHFSGFVLFSMVGGMIPATLFSLAVVLAPDEGSVSTTVGWMQQCSALGQFVGPPLVAWVAIVAGGWHWTWVATGTCPVLGLLVARQVGREAGHG